jgi:hypothetical protein
LRSRASASDRIARLLTFGIEFRATPIELTDASETSLEFDSRTRNRFVGHTDFTRHIRRLEL